MARVIIKTLRRRKGQLFLLEVFIALSVLILMLIALYQVEFTSTPNYQDDLAQIGFNALESLNSAGELKPLIYNSLTQELVENLDGILPANIVWRLSVEDQTGSVLFQVLWDRVPPTDGSVGVTDYILYGFEDNLSGYRIIHLELWRMIG